MQFIITFAAIVVSIMCTGKILMELRDLIHFGAHFHILLRQSI